MAHQWRGVIREYRDRLPVSDATPVITLCEGGTPLIAARTLSERTGCEVWLKFEGANPTGSFKDRGMTMAISKAAESGAKAVICASTGNTSASAAAYATAAGMACAVLVPDGKIAMGKLSQAIAHGAHLLQVGGNFDDCLGLARKLAEAYPVELVNSVNPYRIEGQKTASFEVVDALGDSPDVHCLPVGNAGNITAYWRGYVEYARDGVGAAVTTARDGLAMGAGTHGPGGPVTGPAAGPATNSAAGPATKLPRMWGYQAAGAAPIVLGHPVIHPETVATAIRIGNPASWSQAVAARDSSGGLIEAVTDEEILAASEGVFVEPASAASVAGLLKSHQAGLLDSGQVVVCTVTGHGLKDPQWALRGPDGQPVEPTRVPVDVVTVARTLGLQA
jgi:threonine synthase